MGDQANKIARSFSDLLRASRSQGDAEAEELRRCRKELCDQEGELELARQSHTQISEMASFCEGELRDRLRQLASSERAVERMMCGGHETVQEAHPAGDIVEKHVGRPERVACEEYAALQVASALQTVEGQHERMMAE